MKIMFQPELKDTPVQELVDMVWKPIRTISSSIVDITTATDVNPTLL